MFFRSQSLDDLYLRFQCDLLAGDVDRIKEKLKLYPGLATYNKAGSMSPVISAIHQSFYHQKAPEVLDLLVEHKANFNSTHFNRRKNCEVNPLAWLLLEGGDSRLIKKLTDCGTGISHPSIITAKKLIADHKSEQQFDYSAPTDRNPYDCSPSQLISRL